MPLIIPDLVGPQSQKEDKSEKDPKETKKDVSTQTRAADTSEAKKVDGRTAPGMEGMSDEAIRKFEEAMELEYQKREGGA